jgi:hypothetical protein
MLLASNQISFYKITAQQIAQADAHDVNMDSPGW